MRRRTAPIALGVGIAAVAAVAATSLSGGGEPRGARATAGGGATARVERRTLVQRETVDGTLGFAGKRTVINRLGTAASAGEGGGDTPTTPAAWFAPDEPGEGEETPDEPDGDAPDGDAPDGDAPDGDAPDGERPQAEQPEPEAEEPEPEEPQRQAEPAAPRARGDDSGSADPDSYAGSGTVTALPRAGSLLRRGQAVYRLDGDPVVLMYGSTPAYRALGAGVSDGADVRELELNLLALGFDPGAPDRTFTSATAAAVSAWQDSLGLEPTGSVELGRVVFLPGPRRVGEHKTSVGSVLGSGSEVLDTSSAERVVTVELDAALQDLARRGERVQVSLPGGALARGRIARVGRVAREVESSSADPDAEAQLVIDLTIELARKRGLGSLDEAPVSVGLAQTSRRHVLAVPVNALVARRGGGYGVELAGSRRIVAVEAGLFADGYVEVSGGGVRAGTRVAVPSE